MVSRLVVKSEQIRQNAIALDPQQLHYLLRVLRLGNGDRFIALDGEENSWLAEIEDELEKTVESIDLNTELPRSLIFQFYPSQN